MYCSHAPTQKATQGTRSNDNVKKCLHTEKNIYISNTITYKDPRIGFAYTLISPNF